MRPDFDHVNKESISRVLGGENIEKQQKRQKDAMRMHIVDDGQREQYNRDIEMANEEETDITVHDQSSMAAQKIEFDMTNSQPNDENAIFANIYAKDYLEKILPHDQSDSYQAEITRQREGEMTIERLSKYSSKEYV